jgi:hypothetical protein
VWRDPRDLAQRDLTLERLLQFPPSQRSLARMDALVDEDLAQVVALRELEQPRPQVVVLALEECRVVPKRMALEELAVDEDGRMEEGRAEQRMPAQGTGPAWHEMHPAQLPVGIEVPDARPDDPELRLCLHPRQLALEPLGGSNVVRVQSGDVAAGRLVQRPVEGRGEPGLLLIAENDQTLVVHPSQ